MGEGSRGERDTPWRFVAERKATKTKKKASSENHQSCKIKTVSQVALSL